MVGVKKKWKLTEYLDISEEQGDTFFPRFNSFQKEHKSIHNQIGELFDEVDGMINDDKMMNAPVRYFDSSTSEIFDDFIRHADPDSRSMNPILKCLEIEENQLPNGARLPQLQERIEQSFSYHWYVAPKKEIYDNVSIQMAV